MARRRIAASLFSVLISSVAATMTFAQDARNNAPGQFDFYVLSLLWSPSICQATKAYLEKPRLCSSGQMSSFFVEGLWPQYERGFPEFCQKAAPMLSRKVVDGLLDIMPDPELIVHEWERHGTCTASSPNEFFANVRRASALVKIPDEYRKPNNTLVATSAEIKGSFVRANDGLSSDAIVLACDRERLRGIELCISRDFTFRSCSELIRQNCPIDSIVIPAAAN
jgi:ribonuclease T2